MYRRAGSTGRMYACMHVLCKYVFMHVHMYAPGGIPGSQMGYACIMIVCMYRRAGTGVL